MGSRDGRRGIASTAAGSGTSDASGVAFTPTGNIAATDVQAAMAELDSEKQPLDSDLTAIAALSTTAYGRSLLAAADAAAGRTALQLGTAATVNTGTSSGDVPLLSTGGVLPIGQLATGTPDGTKFVRDDGTLAAPGGLPSGGTQGQALIKQSATAGDATWNTPPWGGGDYFRSGYYSMGLYVFNSFSTSALFLNQIYYRPFVMPVRRAFDRIGINITAGASAGGVLRFGIYSGAGRPETLLADYGTVACTATGAAELTISQTLSPGVWWLAVCPQVAAPTVTAFPNAVVTPFSSTSTTPLSAADGVGWRDNGSTYSGALPSSPGVLLPNTTQPAAMLRAL